MGASISILKFRTLSKASTLVAVRRRARLAPVQEECKICLAGRETVRILAPACEVHRMGDTLSSSAFRGAPQCRSRGLTVTTPPSSTSTTSPPPSTTRRTISTSAAPARPAAGEEDRQLRQPQRLPLLLRRPSGAPGTIWTTFPYNGCGVPVGARRGTGRRDGVLGARRRARLLAGAASRLPACAVDEGAAALRRARSSGSTIRRVSCSSWSRTDATPPAVGRRRARLPRRFAASTA